MEETAVHALDYVAVLRRRVWWVVAPVLLSVVVGLLLVRFLPREYRASAYVGVSAPGVSPAFVGQQTPLDDEERLRAMTQQLVSPDLLTRVIAEEQLGPIPTDAKRLARLRAAVTVTLPEPVPGAPDRRVNTFVISYRDSDPSRAQRVANRIAQVFVEESTRSRATRAEDTSAFISAQLQASQARLADLESGLRREKEAHMGRLPEQTQANLQTLSGLRQQLEANATALRGEQDRLTVTERQIEALTQGSNDVLLFGRAADRPDTPESRVMQIERDLAVARTTYTDKHPEVVRLREELTRAQAALAEDQRRPAQDRLARLKADPTYRQLLADREVARLRIRELERTERDVRSQIGVYQARVEAAPRVEQQLVAVQRDYDLERQQYSDLSAKLRAALIAESVERNGRGEHFRLLSAAPLPDRPLKPIPLQVMLLSILGGIAAGAALGFAREYFDRSVYGARDLQAAVDLPVLGEIDRIRAA
ncbi:MAG: Wzz/FepE/Etk N-terminal domain-containing protein [Vicinamibacterales bacterium]